MEFLGRPFDEANLFEIASAYEAGTKHRRPPKGFGPLKAESHREIFHEPNIRTSSLKNFVDCSLRRRV